MRCDCVRFLRGTAALAATKFFAALTATKFVGALVLGPLALSLPATLAQEFEVPKGSVSFEDTCTLEGVQDDYMQIRDSKTELWVLQIVPETKITVEGEAEPDYLRPGQSIEFVGELNKKGLLADPIEELDITLTTGKSTLGMFPTDGEDDRPVRSPKPGSYRIKGKLASFKRGELLISIGTRKLNASLADEVKIHVTGDDPHLAQVGDTVKVRAYYYDNSKPIAALGRAGKALAEQIDITLAKPLAASGKKLRQTQRPAKNVRAGS